MSNFEGEREGIWDEYDWERFLKQQDQKTEKYMELLEKYIDDPQRDEIVAREMGWCHQPEESGEEWNEDPDFQSDEDGSDEQISPSQLINDSAESFEHHVLYRAAFSL